MYQFTIHVAGLNIGIGSVWYRAMSRSKDYLTDAEPDFYVYSSTQEIEAARPGYIAMNNETDPLDRDIELSVLLAKIADKLVDYNKLLMHGTVVAIDDSAYMFTAPSGTGKSTHVYKWLKYVPGTYVVNGDKPFISTGAQPMACGTPWAGKEHWQANTNVPLKAIVLMERSEENSIHEITFKEAFPRLLQQTHKPDDLTKLGKTLEMLRSLSPAVKFYRFKFNNRLSDAHAVSYQALTGHALPEAE